MIPPYWVPSIPFSLKSHNCVTQSPNKGLLVTSNRTYTKELNQGGHVMMKNAVYLREFKGKKRGWTSEEGREADAGKSEPIQLELLLG